MLETREHCHLYPHGVASICEGLPAAVLKYLGKGHPEGEGGLLLVGCHVTRAALMAIPRGRHPGWPAMVILSVGTGAGG